MGRAGPAAHRRENPPRTCLLAPVRFLRLEGVRSVSCRYLPGACLALSTPDATDWATTPRHFTLLVFAVRSGPGVTGQPVHTRVAQDSCCVCLVSSLNSRVRVCKSPLESARSLGALLIISENRDQLLPKREVVTWPFVVT